MTPLFTACKHGHDKIVRLRRIQRFPVGRKREAAVALVSLHRLGWVLCCSMLYGCATWRDATIPPERTMHQAMCRQHRPLAVGAWQVRLLLVKICDCAASNPSETLAALEKFKHDAIEHGDVNGLTPLQAAADA
jgi:hypothetical protein